MAGGKRVASKQPQAKQTGKKIKPADAAARASAPGDVPETAVPSATGGLLRRSAEMLIESSKGKESAVKEIAETILVPMLDELQWLDEQSDDPVSFGGQMAVTTAFYKEAMTKHGKCSCVVPFRWLGLALEHQDMIPVIGTVKRCYNHFFAKAGPAAMMQFPTVVQAKSCEEVPEKGFFDTMDGGVFRLAWLFGYSMCLQDPAELAKYRASALSIPVVFEMVSGSVVLKKIQLDQNKKAEEVFAGLIGYKLTRMAVKAQEELRSKNRPCGQEQVFEYLNAGVQWTSEDAVSLKSVQMAIKVHGRLSPHACNILDQFESIFGKGHPFCLVQGIDAVCQKTAMPSNPEGREKMKELATVYLAIRRMTLYMQSKLPHAADLGGFLQFHQRHPQGLQANLGKVADLPPATSVAEKMLREAVFCLMDGSCDEHIGNLLCQSPMMNGQALVENADIESSLHFKALLQKLVDEEADKQAKLLLKQQAKAAENAEEAASVAETSQPVPAESQTGSVMESQPELPEEELEQKPAAPRAWAQAFPALIIPESMQVTLAGVDDSVFWNLHRFACARVASNVHFMETPPTDLCNALRDHPVLKRAPEQAEERLLFIYDVKGHCDKTSARYQSRLWHLLSPFDEGHMQACMAATFPLFAQSSVLIVLDGRRGDICTKVRKNICAEAKKSDHTHKKPLGPQYRFIYTNEEFGEGGYAFSPRAKAICMIPDPLETCVTVLGVGVEMLMRPRRFIDLPGSTFTRGLSGLKLRAREHHEVRLCEKVFKELQKGMSAGSEQQEDQQQAGPPLEAVEVSETAAVDDGFYFFPWTCQEEVFLELLNMFGSEGTPAKVVSFCPGFGQAELACIREDVHCLSLVQSKTHREVLTQRLVLTIMIESIRGKRDFLRNRLFPVAADLERTTVSEQAPVAAAVTTEASPIADKSAEGTVEPATPAVQPAKAPEPVQDTSMAPNMFDGDGDEDSA
ncbi:Nek5 [Symbiodinium sp. CCMP2592]|nr:Nek5 [Symbiodinium sp. CCMP2592]